MILKRKKNKIEIYLLIIFLIGFIQLNVFAQTDTLVVIRTSYGTIKLKLYDDTPVHKRNFIKLASNGFYDSLLFHRVIGSFMIQGGDPESRRANSTQTLGNGDIGYTLPPEINAKYFHKKGALAAARQGDDVNPEKFSSGCQFYIVQGKKYAELDMVTVESRMVSQLKQTLTWKYLGKPENYALKARYISFQQARNTDSLNAINKQIQPIIENELKQQKLHKFNTEEKRAYSTMGGSPHLDGNYTVFGEVIDGLEVIDQIAAVEVSGNSRPLVDVRMIVTIEVVKN